MLQTDSSDIKSLIIYYKDQNGSTYGIKTLKFNFNHNQNNSFVVQPLNSIFQLK